MKNLVQEEIKTLVMDHHGLVAATCLDLEIAKKIDERLEKKDPRRVSFLFENENILLSIIYPALFVQGCSNALSQSDRSLTLSSVSC